MCFADKRDEDKVQVGDVVGVRIRDFWFEFIGVMEVA